jgi:hypothetical protein
MNQIAKLDEIMSMMSAYKGHTYVTYDIIKGTKQCRATLIFLNQWDVSINEYCDAYYYFIGENESLSMASQSAALQAINWIENYETAKLIEKSKSQDKESSRNQENESSPCTSYEYPDLDEYLPSRQRSADFLTWVSELTISEAAVSQIVTDIAFCIAKELSPYLLEQNPGNHWTQVPLDNQELFDEYRLKLCRLLEDGGFKEFVVEYYHRQANLVKN